MSLANILKQNAKTTDAMTENGAYAYSINHLNPMVKWFYMANNELHNIITSRDIENRHSPFDVLQTKLTEEIVSHIRMAKNEPPQLHLYGRFLGFLRDPRNGLGMRSMYRAIMSEVLPSDADLNILVRYGRYDDLIAIEDATKDLTLKHNIQDFIRRTLEREDSSANLLCKWMPSENTHSKTTCRLAKKWMRILGMTPKQYRKTLTRGRKAMDITEHHLNGEALHTTNYPTVPSNAMTRYSKLFAEKDSERYAVYVDNVKKGKAKVNVSTTNPVELYTAHRNTISVEEEELLDERFKLIMQNTNHPDIIPVVDLSGSMDEYVTNTVRSSDIARSISYYLSQTNKGEYKNLCIGFGDNAKVLSFENCNGLNDVMGLFNSANVGWTTNVEAVFTQLLDFVVMNNLGEIPPIAIITDCEFNTTLYRSEYKNESALMEHIKEMYEKSGVKFPKVIFWNTQNRSDSIPVLENKDINVTYLSGFSHNIVDMITTGDFDTTKVLLEKLNEPVWNEASYLLFPVCDTYPSVS